MEADEMISSDKEYFNDFNNGGRTRGEILS